MRLKLSTLKNAQIMPLLGSMDSFHAGVFKDGEFVEGSLLERGTPSQLFPIQRKLTGAYIYGGCLFGHFGHFLLESASRLYAFQQCQNLPILFLSPNTSIISSQAAMLKLLGAGNELILVKDPIEVEQLVFSPAGSSINPPYMSDEQLAALARFPVPTNPKRRKVWLSRSQFFGGGQVDNEADIEAVLAASGWEIIHPEDLSLRDQIQAVNASTYVAGFDGSAFYSSLLAKETQGKFIIFGRRSVIPAEIPYLLERKNIAHELHPLPVEYRSGEGAASCYHLPDISLVTDVLSAL